MRVVLSLPSYAPSLLVLHSAQNGSDAFGFDLISKAAHSLRVFLVCVGRYFAKQLFCRCDQEQSFNIGLKAAYLVQFNR